MARISTYGVNETPTVDDYLIGSETPNPGGDTKNFKISNISSLILEAGLVEHADNAAALTAGLVAGQIYRTGDDLKIVHN
jgi:hypothetical protein